MAGSQVTGTFKSAIVAGMLRETVWWASFFLALFWGAHSYASSLPPIAKAANAQLLTVDNTSESLHRLMGDKLVLLSFIYSSCNDVNGCPLATQVLHKISRQLRQQAVLAENLRLLTISFNPLQDTPEKMRQYGLGMNEGGLDWQFLTAASEQALQPLLDGYPQNIQKIYDESGRFTGGFSHLLRVYLIDRNLQIRNIYSVDFLKPELILADVRKLLDEKLQPMAPVITGSSEVYWREGDDKERYQQADYQTHSLALSQRQGKKAPLMDLVRQPPLGLPKLAVPVDNPVTPEKIELGRRLFYDRRLSLNGTFSCAMCHIPEQGFTSHEMATAVGVEGRSVRRNSPSLYNVGYARLLFHDGRENSLEQQVWGPLLAANEMANPSIAVVVDKINALADYRQRFRKVFKQDANMLNIGQALASYQRSLNSADSAFDRWSYGHQPEAMSESAQRGLSLFNGKAGCQQCHTIGSETALLTDQKRHNTGIGYAASMLRESGQQLITVAPGVNISVDRKTLSSVAPLQRHDLGYYEVTQQPADRWAYKTPSLRNIALTAPYMHDGSLVDLPAVLDFYDQGGVANENLSPMIKPLHLTAAEKQDLLDFLRALTGSNIETLVGDAFAAPVADWQ